MLLRLAYLGVTNMIAPLRLLAGSDHDKDTEILELRHQLAVLQRQLGDSGSDSFPPIGRCWPPCSTGSPAPRCGTYGC